jgi:hypothetical protein
VEFAAAADTVVYTEELVTTDTLISNDVEFVAAVNEELVTVDTLITNDVELVAATTPTAHNEELVDADTLANNDEKLVTAHTLADTKTHEHGACREVPDREERRDSAERQVQVAIYTWINILKNICAKSMKIAAEVYSVELRSRSDVEQQEAGATAPTNLQNTKNYVDVVSAKRTQVEKVAKTIIDTDTAAPKTETTNKFEIKFTELSVTIDFSENVGVETDARAQVEKTAKTPLHA